jgi:hypothetical protein
LLADAPPHPEKDVDCGRQDAPEYDDWFEEVYAFALPRCEEWLEEWSLYSEGTEVSRSWGGFGCAFPHVFLGFAPREEQTEE